MARDCRRRRRGRPVAGAAAERRREHERYAHVVRMDRSGQRGGRGRRVPGRPVDGDHAGHGVRRVDLGRHLLARLHARERRAGARLRTVLRVSRALRVFDVRAGARGQLPAVVRRVGTGRTVQLSADRLPLPATGRGRGGEEGVPGQPDRRLRFRPGRAADLSDLRNPQLRRRVRGRRRRHGPTRPDHHASVADHRPVAAVWSGGQERSIAAVRVVAGCDGRPVARLGPDSRRHDGDRGRVHDRPVWRDLHSLAGRDDGGGSDRRTDGAVCRHDRADPVRHEAHPGLLDDQPIGLHVSGVGRVRRSVGRLSSVHACVLQGPALSGGGQRDARDGRGDRRATVQRVAARDADDLSHVPDRRARAGRRSSAVGVLQQGRDPSSRLESERRVGTNRFGHRSADGRLYVPHDLPGLSRTAARAGGRTCARVAEVDDRAVVRAGGRRGLGRLRGVHPGCTLRRIPGRTHGGVRPTRTRRGS